MTEQKKVEKNRIVINLTTSAVEVESSTESLDKVYKIIDDVIVKILTGRTEELKRRVKITNTAIG